MELWTSENLIAARRGINKTQQEVADVFKVSRRTYGLWEQNGPPSYVATALPFMFQYHFNTMQTVTFSSRDALTIYKTLRVVALGKCCPLLNPNLEKALQAFETKKIEW